MRTSLFAAAVAVCLASTADAAPIAVTGDPVLYWNEVLLGGTNYNPGQVRPAALMNIAVHDAVNATVGRPNYSYLGPIATPGGDTRAAASVAARNVLVTLYPARTAEFDAALAASLALVPDGVAKTNGIATGAKIAAAAIAKRANDGTFAPSSYTPSGLPGRWAPTPPGNFPAVNPQLATSDPWIMTSNDQFRAAPPPALGSAAYTAAFNEVKEIGAANSATRTEDQTKSALFWAGASGPGPWIRAVLDVAADRGLSSIEYARILALLSTSIGDAVVVAWDSKFTYDYWRPVTAIRLADLDGNPDTVADPNWNSLFPAPAHPSYLSAHSTISGAAATILGLTLGDDTPFCVTAGANSRCWSGFDDAATDSANSRLWGGIHWSFDNQAGLDAGRLTGLFDFNSLAFDAVPEPENWAMLIAGFGLVGAAARRRRQVMTAS